MVGHQQERSAAPRRVAGPEARGRALRPRRFDRLLPVLLVWLAASLCAGPAHSDEPVQRPVVAAIEALDLGAVEARTGALLLSGQAGGEIEGALVWSMTGHGPEGRAEVPFVVEVDGEELLRNSRGRRLMLGVFAYIVGDDGRVVDYLAQGLILEPELYAATIARTGLKFVGRFQLDAGSYALRVMVRNQETGAFFLSWSLVDVPAADDSAARLLPPLFPDPVSGWLVAAQGGGVATVAVGPGRTVLPAARPMLAENRPAELFVNDHGWGADVRVGVRIVNEIGRTVAEPVSELGPAPDANAGLRRLTLSPVHLPPGAYTLILTLDENAGGELLRRAIRVVVVAEHDLRAWATTPGAAGSDTAEATGGGEQAPRMRPRELRDAYLEALSTLAAGDAHGASLALAGIERRALSDPTPKALRELTDTEQEVVKKLAATDPASLAPVALLHRDLERSYTARSEGMLAAHARAMTVTTAEHLGRLRPGGDFSANLMVSVAVDLAEAMASASARNLLERTLRLAPGHGPALLSLGFSFERAAEYHEASLAYGSLVSADPQHREGRLRLALNLVRTGRRQAGEEMLRALLDDGEQAWIEALAAQELVRNLLGDGRTAEAEREVRADLQRRPDDQRLWILLGAILDAEGRHAESVDTLRSLPPATRGVSPRARYAEWPELGFAASRQQLATAAREGLPALGAALAEVRR